MSLKRNKLLSLHGDRKPTFNSQQPRLLLTILTVRDLSCIDFFPKYDNTQTRCFFGANEMTPLQAYNLSRYFFDTQISKTNSVTAISK